MVSKVKKMKINSILIANRGEIAIRIAKTAKKMNITTWMFRTYQEPNAYYLEYADFVIDITSENFINIFMNVDKIVESTVKNNIDAVHPGYGFLSENPALPKECEHNNIIFIGPSHNLIDLMGNKGKARELASKAGVPILKGSKSCILTVEEAIKTSEEIGYPVIIKAVAGGGGKGMRIAKSDKEISKMYKQAVNEARSVFGNGSVFIEKYIENPKHIEFQILADKHNNTVHLYERECSIQRKHQKLMEEAPSPALNDTLRNKIGMDAVKLCKEVGYYSAGTVEFLLDSNLKHYFMEMNTRIQVEHPITESITEIDLIEQQIKIARDEKLKLEQKDISIKGCAIEFRINAEDVQSDFTPDTGIIDEIEFPENNNLRIDTGYTNGKVIPSCYDSLIAKVIVNGENREEMIAISKQIINEINLKGVKSTIPFFKAVIQNDKFLSGDYSTSFIENELNSTYHQEEGEYIAASALALTAYLNEVKRINSGSGEEKRLSSWSLNHFLKQ